MDLSENRSRAVTPRDWDTLREVFLATPDLPPGERPAYLDQAFHGNPELHDKVEDLRYGRTRPQRREAIACASARTSLHDHVAGRNLPLMYNPVAGEPLVQAFRG